MSSYVLDLFRPLFRRKKVKKAGMPRKGRMSPCQTCGTQHVVDRAGGILGTAAQRRHDQNAKRAAKNQV